MKAETQPRLLLAIGTYMLFVILGFTASVGYGIAALIFGIPISFYVSSFFMFIVNSKKAAELKRTLAIIKRENEQLWDLRAKNAEKKFLAEGDHAHVEKYVLLGASRRA